MTEKGEGDYDEHEGEMSLVGRLMIDQKIVVDWWRLIGIGQNDNSCTGYKVCHTSFSPIKGQI